jgi:prolipoprotein diacylglyceryltransferase
LLLVDRRFRIKPPALFALYVSIYTFGRFFEELLRIDPAHELLGLRLNAWVSIVLFIVSTAFFIWWQFLRQAPGPEALPRGRVPEGPAMAIPKGRVR